MEVISFSHLPVRSSAVHIGLFRNVENAKDLRARLIKASSLSGEAGNLEREAVNFAFIDARMITSILHLQTAIYQAVLADLQGALRTKTIHSEILWTLNPSNNISEAIRRYGVGDDCTSLIVVRVASPELSEVQERITSVIEGVLSPFDEIENVTDWKMIKKYHKLGTSVPHGSAAERKAVDNIVVSSVAMKSVLG